MCLTIAFLHLIEDEKERKEMKILIKTMLCVTIALVFTACGTEFQGKQNTSSDYIDTSSSTIVSDAGTTDSATVDTSSCNDMLTVCDSVDAGF
jgi:hypothetical protein